VFSRGRALRVAVRSRSFQRAYGICRFVLFAAAGETRQRPLQGEVIAQDGDDHRAHDDETKNISGGDEAKMRVGQCAVPRDAGEGSSAASASAVRIERRRRRRRRISLRSASRCRVRKRKVKAKAITISGHNIEAAIAGPPSRNTEAG
jgi:hypothetical protein